MNCDEVFQQLTRFDPATFAPGAAACDAIARHLARCPACREMAELFRPAVESFSDTVEPNDIAAEPSESWQRVWEAVGVAERSAAQLRAAAPPRRAWLRTTSLVRSAALLLVGVAIGAVVSRSGAAAHPTLQVQSPSADPSNPAVPAISRPHRCERLVSATRDAGDDVTCPTCSQPIERARLNVAALCIVCHGARQPG